MADGIARKLRQTMTPQEVRVWVRLRALKSRGLHFRRQVPIGGYIVDFACYRPKVVIEIDGSQHGFDEHAKKDRDRDAYLGSQGFRVLRFWNGDVNRDIGAVVETILAAAGETSSPTRAAC